MKVASYFLFCVAFGKISCFFSIIMWIFHASFDPSICDFQIRLGFLQMILIHKVFFV